jgi:urease accessory protein
MTPATATNTTTEPAAAPLAAASLLQLIWLASPALPVGGFSYSEGLEAAIDTGHVGTEAQAADWLSAQLHLGIARSEAPLVAAAFRAWAVHDRERISALNAWCHHTRESAEFAQQCAQMGRSLTEWLRHRDAADPRLPTLAALTPAPAWPIAFGLAAQQTGAPLHDALLAFAFGWAENMVQAAIKAVPLGQAAGQRMLARLSREIPAAVAQAMSLDDEADGLTRRQAFTPMLAILSAQHETQYSRLFRS